MRSLGLLLAARGASADYFRQKLDEEMRERGLDQGVPVMSIHFGDADDLLAEEKWWTLAQCLRKYARDLAAGGVEGLILGSLEWYLVADDFASDLPIPLLHPVDALDQEILRRGQNDLRLGIIAPSLMTHSGALLDRFTQRGTRQVVLPGSEDAAKIDALVEKVGLGDISPTAARQFLYRLTDDLRKARAGGIVIGTPELMAMVAPERLGADCYDLADIQTAAMADWMLAEQPRLLP